MAEVYVTLGEAAELERVKYNTMVKRVLRKQESFVTKTEKSENGGKDVYLWRSPHFQSRQGTHGRNGRS